MRRARLCYAAGDQIFILHVYCNDCAATEEVRYATYFGFVTAYSSGCGPLPNMLDTPVLNYRGAVSFHKAGKRSTVKNKTGSVL